jgi:hypothetical protein
VPKFKAYIDESGTHRGAGTLVLGGYLFESRAARMFSRDWQACLLSLDLPFAHMTDCANGFGHYKNWTKEKRVLSEKQLISLIHKYAVEGFCISVNANDYSRIMGDPPILYSAYTFLLMQCVGHLSKRAMEIDSSSTVEYIFENGHSSKNQAEKYMKTLPLVPVPSSKNYSKHHFGEKKTEVPLQAADMLVWQFRHHLVESIKRPTFKRRKDFEALLRVEDLCTEIEPVHLVHLVQMFEAATNGSKVNPGAGIAYLRNNPYFTALLR